MSTTTTTQRHSPTVLDHGTSKTTKAVQKEIWASFAAEFDSTGGKAYLQPGQFLPIWGRNGINREWRCKTSFQLEVMSAFVVEGRYMISGGDNKIKSHPLIEEWEADAPVKGRAAQLRFPGELKGLKRVKASNIPTLVANAGNFETEHISATVFHRTFANAHLRKGCPIVIACRHDACEKHEGTQHPAIDIYRGEAVTLLELPFPIITSNEEEVVLAAYPESWVSGIKHYCDMMGVTEIGVLYCAEDSDEVTEDISNERPNLVYRNVISTGDLGYSTLDPNLYERMLPFASGRFNSRLLARI